MRAPARRSTAVGAVAAAALLVAAAASLALGDVPVPLGDVLRSVTGAGDPGTDFIVLDLRLPRVAVAALAGLALGASGALFQAVTRNPLGSPDVVGLTAGASAGAVTALVLGGSGAWGAPASATAGGLVAAALVTSLSWQRGTGVTGYRLVLVGVAVAAVGSAVVTWLLVRASVQDAAQAVVWLAGSLAGRGWPQAVPLGVGLVVLLPVAALLLRPLGLLALGDDVARGLGARTAATRLAVVVVATVLAALAVAACGPVAFVALTAPQVAGRLARSPGPPLAPAALVGAVLLVTADLLAQHVLPGRSVPVGVVTGVLGGGYLAWLLAREFRWRVA